MLSSLYLQNLADCTRLHGIFSAIRMSDLADVSETLDISGDKSLVLIFKVRFWK